MRPRRKDTILGVAFKWAFGSGTLRTAPKGAAKPGTHSANDPQRRGRAIYRRNAGSSAVTVESSIAYYTRALVKRSDWRHRNRGAQDHDWYKEVCCERYAYPGTMARWRGVDADHDPAPVRPSGHLLSQSVRQAWARFAATVLAAEAAKCNQYTDETGPALSKHVVQ